MGDNVVELSNHGTMTPDQCLARAQRVGFVNVIVIGQTTGLGIDVYSSDMSNEHLAWLAAKAAAGVLEFS